MSSIKVGKPFRLFNDNELKSFETIIELLYTMGPEWDDYKTRTSNRKYISIPVNYIPSEYSFLNGIIRKIIETAKETVAVDDEIIPLQMFVNYYNNGSNSAPGHRHGCRQITVSFGCPRILKVNTKDVILETGDAIFLNQQKHSVPKLDENSPFFDSPRISFNLFFTTKNEERFDIYKK